MTDSKKPRTLEDVSGFPDARLSSPSSARNKDPLLKALREDVSARSSVLEVASGTGEHAVHFCTALPHLRWQPSDIADEALASIAAWRAATTLENLAAPLSLNLLEDNWWAEVEPPVDFVMTCNLLHIAPWDVTRGLMRGAGALLAEGGALAIYGAFCRDGAHTAPSNEEFDRQLRARDPHWGVRDIVDVAGEAGKHGLALEREIEMPANNLVLLFCKGAA